MWYCRSSHRSSTMSCGAPASRFSRSRWLIRSTSTGLCVGSSSERSPDSSVIDGRTVTGGTRSAVSTIHSGRADSGSIPRTLTSSFGMRSRRSRTSRGVRDVHAELLLDLEFAHELLRLLSRQQEPAARPACGLEELLDLLHVADVDDGHREGDVAAVARAFGDLAAARLAPQSRLDYAAGGVHE